MWSEPIVRGPGGWSKAALCVSGAPGLSEADEVRTEGRGQRAAATAAEAGAATLQTWADMHLEKGEGDPMDGSGHR